MGWKEKMKEFGGGDLAFLSEDGEVIMFMVVGEPVLLAGKFKGRPSEKIGCPIVTTEGFALLVAGKRLARKIAKYEDNFNDTALMAVRHGSQNEITTSYELKVVSDEAVVRDLIGIRESSNFEYETVEAIKAAEGVMKQ